MIDRYYPDEFNYLFESSGHLHNYNYHKSLTISDLA